MEKSPKNRDIRYTNAYFTKNLHEDPEYSDFRHKILNYSVFQAEYTEIRDIRWYFSENWENHSIAHKVNFKY